MTTDMQIYEGSAAISLWRKPEEVLAEAQEAATALMTVMGLKKHKVMFNNEQYLEREDWGTVAKFYGCTAKSTETRYVEFGNVRGFEATAVCITHDMREIGRAESMCLSDEENWGEVAKYEWQDELDENGKKIWVKGKDGKDRPKGKKVQIGTVSKPLFQLKSMAQTRAEAKVLKSVFGWVVVLAGYRTTPAEEMTGNEPPEDDEPQQGRQSVKQPSRASEKTAAKQEEQKKAAEPDKITGIIESSREGKEGAVWVVVDKKMVIIEAKFVDDSIKVGEMFSAKVQKRHSDKLKDNGQEGAFWAVLAMLEPPKVVEAEKKQEASTEPPAANNEAPAQTVKDMVDSGQVQSASSLPAGNGKKPGTIGSKRAQRMYALINQNKAKTGWSEEEAKKMLLSLPIPITSMSDLDVGYYDKFERMATGEEDWREWYDSDEGAESNG